MIVMYLLWMLIRQPAPPSAPVALPTDGQAAPDPSRTSFARRVWGFLTYNDAVDVRTVDLKQDEHEEEPADYADDARRESKLKGRYGWLWKVYYAVV